jgi:hypothetical protein
MLKNNKLVRYNNHLRSCGSNGGRLTDASDLDHLKSLSEIRNALADELVSASSSGGPLQCGPRNIVAEDIFILKSLALRFDHFWQV